MQIDNIISQLRIFRQELITHESENIPVIPHVLPQDHCPNTSYTIIGYYRRHNGEFVECHVEKKNDADFCMLECNTCHQNIYLFNTGEQNWDDFFEMKEKMKVIK